METSLGSPLDRPKITDRTQRSRITNGKDLLAGIDQRTATYRRYRDLIDAILGDQGGVEHCSESRKQLVRRFASISVICEQAEAKLVAGEQIDVQEHALLCSTLTRLVSRLGIDRIAKDISPTLSDFIRKRPT
jgi:hypothetical protein